MSNIFFILCSFIYIVLLAVVYFTRNKVSNLTNKLYSTQIFITLIGTCLEMISYLIIYVLHQSIDSYIYILSIKFILIYYISWIFIFTLYIWGISRNKELSFKKNIVMTVLVYILFVMINLCLPINFLEIGGLFIPSGLAVDSIYIVSSICLIFMIVIMARLGKKVFNKKYIPIFCFLFLGMIMLLFQRLNPSYFLLTPLQAFVTFIMYFTIENPDVKMLEEYKKNKEFAEAANREKEVFLYSITQEMRKPLNEIGVACNKLSLMTDDKELNKGINYINIKSKRLLGEINNVLDITNLEACNIKIYETKYNPKLLLEELVKMSKKDLHQKVDFRVTIDKSIPDLLFGDSIRVKQIIKILLENSMKYTTEGYIQLEAHEIIKNNVCRLIITVEDSGNGIRADELDAIFAKENEFESKKIDDTKKNLAIAKSISNILGGLLTFNSEIGQGTKFTLILDQIIVTDKSKEAKKIEKYTEYIMKTKVIIVSEDKDYLENAVKKMSKYDLDVEGINLGSKCVEKIRHNNKYNYILLDEDIDTLNVEEVLNKLKEMDNFKTKVFVLSRNVDNDKYIKMGFDKVLSRRLKGSELEDLSLEKKK